MDEVQQRTGLLPTPITWPVGQSGDFRGVLDRTSGEYTKYTRTDGGATIAGEDTYTSEAAADLEGDAWTTAVDESDLLEMEDQNHDQETFLAGKSTPVMFASAVLNFGIHKLLDLLVDLAPPAEARLDKDDQPRPVDDPFSGFVFKVQAGMDSHHRDRLAYIRVCSGVFERGTVLTHASTGKPFATKYAQQVFGRDRDVVDEAFPGDVVGLVNASALRVGDSLYLDKKVEFPGIPTFSPEHFMVIRAKDSSKYKQFRRGIEQLDHEGVIQVLRSDLRGDQAPVLGAVGPMQFEVAEDRMTNEFNAPCTLERLNFSLARRTTPECVPTLARERSVEVLHRSDGELLALFSDRWRLQGVQKNHPDLVLEPLVVS
jgi:peptide chain release factor 3